MCRCINELERIYGVYNGNHKIKDSNNFNPKNQKAQEGKMWEEIETRKASLRRRATQNNKTAKAEVDNVPPQDKGENGKSRDIIAEKVGIGSGRTYERAKNAIDKIDEYINKI